MRAADLFAGWGGFTEGAEQAGVEVVWAGNHWELAVAAHAKNHPRTLHVCQDLRQADWSKMPDYGLLLASPCCQSDSQAAQPSRAKSESTRRKHDALRATAWAVIDCADVTEPRAVLVENVPEFRKWRLYPVWKDALERLGYHVREYMVNAAAFGVPQLRKRLFVLASRERIELRIPTVRRAPAFGPHIEWKKGDWRPIAEVPRPGSRRRLEIASARFGRALVQHVSHHRGLPLTEPLRTITGQDQWAVVDHGRYRPLTIRETARGMGFPDHYAWPGDVRRCDAMMGLGQAVPPPAARNLVGQVVEACHG